MPKNILVDLNVIVDVFLQRQGYQASADVMSLGEKPGVQLFVSAHEVTTLAYLLEAAKVPKAQIQNHLGWVLQTFSVIPVNEKLLSAALDSNLTDYEDALVEQAALSAQCHRIITRNSKDFARSTVLAATPEQYLSR